MATANHELFNSSVAWDTDKYPWQRLVEVVMTTPISHSEIENTRFNIGNRPDCLTIPQPKSKWDYNSLAYARESTYKKTQTMRMQPLVYGENIYNVVVKTKSIGGAGTDSDVYISIIGRCFRSQSSIYIYHLSVNTEPHFHPKLK